MTAGLALAAALAATTAPAADVFGAYQSLCVAHRGDLNASVSAAEALGWQALPAEMMKSVPADLKDPKARVKMSEAGIVFLFTGHGQFPAGGRAVNADLCLVGARPADYAALQKSLTDFARVAPLPAQSGQDQVAYGWTDDASGRHAFTGMLDGAATAALKDHRATMAFVKSFQGGAMLAYAVPTL